MTPTDDQIRTILKRTKNIACVGVSMNTVRPSSYEARYLKLKGFRVIGVNPGTAGQEQFGETLAVWGVETGPYLMLPFLGPSDPRSFTGDYVDGFAFPMTLIDGTLNLARIGISVLETRAQLIEQEAQLEQAVDDYAFIKNAYFERLEFRVTDGKSAEKALDEEQLDDFADFEAMLDGGDFDYEEIEEPQTKDKEDEDKDDIDNL